MNDTDIQAQLNYLCRDKYYHAMQTVASDALSKNHSEKILLFYKAMAMLLGNYIPEAMRELEALEDDEIVYLAAILGLIYAHKRSVVMDRDALKELDSSLKERRKKAQPTALYYAALFLFHCGKYDKAKEYLDRALKHNQAFIEGLVLKGWIELNTVKNENYLKDALHYFQSALDYDSNNLDALFGLITVDKMTQKYDTAIAVLNRLIVKHPTLVTPLVEKMKVQLAQRDWDQVLDLSNRILNIDRSNIEAIKLQAMCLLCRDGKYDETSGLLEMLFGEMERNEPKNVTLYVLIAQVFSRVCGRNDLLLLQTFKFAEQAVQLAPNGVASLTELGYQMMMQGKLKGAIETFQSATKLDESSVDALTYLTFCQILDEGSVQLAQQQLALLYEIQGKKTAMLLLMSAMTSRDNTEKALSFLGEATVVHFDKCVHLPYGDNYLTFLDPDFLLLIVKEYFRYFPARTSFSDESSFAVPPNEAARKCTMILNKITEDCPALIEALFLLARVQFHTGDITSATNALTHIIKDVDATLVGAHLMLARIYLHQGMYQRAAQVLEVGVSYNFLVRENPLYHLINGMIAKKLNKLDECIQSLTLAMLAAGLSEDADQVSVDKNNELPLMDKATLYLELADANLLSNNKTEAQRIMHDASDIFRGTTEESRVTIANAEFLLKNQQIDIAFEMLEKIKPGDPYYLQAHTKLANLYLHKRRDRNAFTKCFREVVENCPGPETFVLLGDAYMSVLELDLAIESYQQALKQNVHDTILASKMGRALVTTFRYDEAIIYYKEAIKNPINSALKYDLAELYVKLDRFEEAEAILSENIADINMQSDDPTVLSARVKQLLLLAKVRENGGKFSSALSVTKEARDIQHKIQRRSLMDQTGGISEQKATLSDICVRLADICKHLRDSEQAIQHYKEALNATPNDPDILIALAKLYMQVNDQEHCEQACTSILKMNPENEAASVIMADLAYRKVDFDTAMHHFKQLLVKQPTYWTALARLIEVARRTGNLDDMPEYLKRAEQNCNAPSKEAGFSYCTALHEWYSGNLNAALRNFNRARLDQEWGQQAIYNMIEICLNPDDDLLGGDIFSETVDNIDSRQMALEMAERLHRELKPRAGGMENESLSHRLLKNFILLATKQKPNIERALQDFTTIASHEVYRDHVGPILGLASAYVILKQAQRARNHLKRVVKNAWTYEDAEYLERCWLLLADNYLQSSKYEIASDLLKRVLQHNKSCVKAYEYAGYIAEKDQNYREAALNYANAWRLCGSCKPAIGYKLAYTYMKSRQYADAIDVSNQVLKDFPEYPKIKKDILEKARNNLRT